MSDVTWLVKDFLPFAQKRMGFDKAPTIIFKSDKLNSQEPLGKTAYYMPDELTITVFVDGRHAKDILRSLSHELVHHTQNCRGELKDAHVSGPNYAQEDGHLRNMEKDAYLTGNMCFRDWEDKRKNQLQETNYISN